MPSRNRARRYPQNRWTVSSKTFTSTGFRRYAAGFGASIPESSPAADTKTTGIDARVGSAASLACDYGPLGVLGRLSSVLVLGLRGSSAVNVEPLPGSELARTVPPCASTICRVMNNPIPSPA